MTTYSELRLRIDRGVSRGSYRIVATGPAGEALGRFKMPVLRAGARELHPQGRQHAARPAADRLAGDGACQELRDQAVRRAVRGRRARVVPLVVFGDAGRGPRSPPHAVADRRAGAAAGSLGVPVRPPELPLDLDLDADRPVPRPPQAAPPAADRTAAADPGVGQRPERCGGRSTRPRSGRSSRRRSRR